MQIIKRARYLYNTEGFSPLIRQALSFLTRHIFERKCYYIIEHRPARYLENNFLPSIPDYIFKRIEADDIDKNDPLVMYVYGKVADAREKLESGAIAFCIFVNGELATIGWVAMNERANDSLFQPPFKVNFRTGEAATGGGWTDPRYRAKHIYTYNYYRRLQYLWENGRTVAFAAVLEHNVPGLKMHARFKAGIRGKGTDLRILGRRSWKEMPVNMELSRIVTGRFT